jgi:uncharacterized repeat protein (TIGR03806 family)
MIVIHMGQLLVAILLLLCAAGCQRGQDQMRVQPRSSQRVKPYLNMPMTRGGALPKTLSQVGAFEELASLKPVAGLVAYDVNQSFWSDGASKRRWIGLPAGGHIQFSQTGEWKFQPGTVFVKHFEFPASSDASETPAHRLETRILVCDADGGVYGASYKWRADGTDADLVTEPITAPVTPTSAAGHQTQNWYFPGLEDCRMCHTPAAGGVLGVKTRQINRPYGPQGDNQLLTWRRLGLFADSGADIDPHALPRLSGLDDSSRSVEERARSFLDVNCSNCHRPGGVAGNFDARYDTPLANQNLIGGPVLIDLGIDRAKVVAPHDVWRSLALVRVETADRTRMPPLAHETIDQQGAQVLRQWINSLPGAPVLDPPAIQPKGGEFRRALRIELTEREPGAAIHYTLDGSLPGTSSPLYRGPIEITEPTTLRARAFKDGMTRSIVVQETFIVND